MRFHWPALAPVQLRLMTLNKCSCSSSRVHIPWASEIAHKSNCAQTRQTHNHRIGCIPACWETSMRRQYLHLSAYSCDRCAGPVIAGSMGVRENEISKETDIRSVGAICLSCGHRQCAATEPARVHHLMPMEWAPADTIKASRRTTAFVEALNRAELH